MIRTSFQFDRPFSMGACATVDMPISIENDASGWSQITYLCFSLMNQRSCQTFDGYTMDNIVDSTYQHQETALATYRGTIVGIGGRHNKVEKYQNGAWVNLRRKSL